VQLTDPITRTLMAIQQRLAADGRGELATYIPQLATANPDHFGLALASLDGHIYQAGDALVPFTIQSVSKPFVHALALADIGQEGVLARVGAEPSGESFSTASLEPGTGRPMNPMINAGAIVTTSLVAAADPSERFERIRAFLSRFAGRELKMDEAVYRSESETGDNNRALGYLMRNAGALTAPVEESVDVYFRQCALLVTAVDLAVMAATLANGGVNPVTGDAVINDDIAANVMTIMGTCGMYTFSGEWLLRVGLPAKSGVGGGVVAASPAEFGIGLFSPLLDERSNSLRSIEACKALAARFDLHLLHHPGLSAPVIALRQTGREAGISQDRGDAIALIVLQGDLNFACAEQVMRALELERERRWLVLDLDRVGRLHRAANALLLAVIADLEAAGMAIVVADSAERRLISGVRRFPSRAKALRWCKSELLKSHESDGKPPLA